MDGCPSLRAILVVMESWVPVELGSPACPWWAGVGMSAVQEPSGLRVHHPWEKDFKKKKINKTCYQKEWGWPLDNSERVMFITPDSVWLKPPHYFWKSFSPSSGCLLSCHCHQPLIKFQPVGWRLLPTKGFNCCCWMLVSREMQLK